VVGEEGGVCALRWARGALDASLGRARRRLASGAGGERAGDGCRVRRVRRVRRVCRVV
jgi:hypothetical protein